MWRNLSFCRGLFFFSLGGLSALAQLGLLAFGATGIALGARDDINNHAAVVLAAIGARAMRDAKSAAVAGRHPHAFEAMVRAPLGGLGAIPTHSYYHIPNTILIFPRFATKLP